MKRLLAKKGFILYIGTVRKKRIQTDTLNKAQLPAPKKRASGSGRSTIRSHVSDLPFPQESFTVTDSPGRAPDSMFRLCGWSDMMIQFSSIIIIQTHNVVTCCFMRKCQILKVIWIHHLTLWQRTTKSGWDCCHGRRQVYYAAPRRQTVSLE